MDVFFLDVGREKYGDCILVRHEGFTLLIDGAHSADVARRYVGHVPIPEQLQSLLGGPPPHRLSLLVVTHCHSDHIGCLPKLVADDVLRFDDALVADEKLGFGRVGVDAVADPLAAPGMPDAVRQIVAALREEPRGPGDSDEEIRAFLADAATLEDRYNEMLATLAARGTQVVRYRGQPPAALEQKYAAPGLKILGPNLAHLEVCADVVARYVNDAIAVVSDFVAQGADADPVALYRATVASGLSDSADMPGKGAAINNQSIVLTVGAAGKKVLLAGDMQFAKPEIAALDGEMTALRAVVRGAGPFHVAKTCHHTSYNGLDKTVLADHGGKPFLVHCGGSNDPGHPDAGALSVLRARRLKNSFARTDRNGLIGIQLTDAEVKVERKRGRLNDFTLNGGDPVAAAPAPASAPVAPVAAEEPPVAVVAPVAIERTTAGPVEVILRLPDGAAKVTLSLEIEPRPDGVAQKITAQTPGDSGAAAAAPLRVGGGRALPHLLFATSREALRRKFGNAATARVLVGLRAAGTVLDTLPAGTVSADPALAAVRATIARGGFEGVVLVGGYDVVPALRHDTLDEPLRASLPSPTGDADEFIVWSDAEYGDVDGDDLPEIPVSRVPDGGSEDLLCRVLEGGAAADAGAFGVRNRERPFADAVFKLLEKKSRLLLSAPTAPADFEAARCRAQHVYFMLHGSDRDGTRFWGEDEVGTCEALNLRNVPPALAGTVFTGCCWGALVVEQPALYQTADRLPAPRRADASLALAFLQAGARAFVGCTGSHYSPGVAPYAYFGGPLHTAFWKRLLAGAAPAAALFAARGDYLAGMPHGRTRALEVAIELKIYHEFTCLGLGW